MYRGRKTTAILLVCFLYLGVYSVVHAQSTQAPAASTPSTAENSINNSNKDCPQPDKTHQYDSARGASWYVITIGGSNDSYQVINLYGKSCPTNVQGISGPVEVQGKCQAPDTCKASSYVGPDGKTHNIPSNPADASKLKPVEPIGSKPDVTNPTDKNFTEIPKTNPDDQYTKVTCSFGECKAESTPTAVPGECPDGPCTQIVGSKTESVSEKFERLVSGGKTVPNSSLLRGESVIASYVNLSEVSQNFNNYISGGSWEPSGVSSPDTSYNSGTYTSPPSTFQDNSSAPTNLGPTAAEYANMPSTPAAPANSFTPADTALNPWGGVSSQIPTIPFGSGASQLPDLSKFEVPTQSTDPFTTPPAISQINANWSGANDPLPYAWETLTHSNPVVPLPSASDRLAEFVGPTDTTQFTAPTASPDLVNTTVTPSFGQGIETTRLPIAARDLSYDSFASPGAWKFAQPGSTVDWAGDVKNYGDFVAVNIGKVGDWVYGENTGVIAQQEQDRQAYLANLVETQPAPLWKVESVDSGTVPANPNTFAYNEAGDVASDAQVPWNRITESPELDAIGKAQKALGFEPTREPAAPVATPIGETKFEVTAYYPCPSASACPIQGGPASSVKGPDGEAVVRTLDDYRTGKSDYVTAASDKSRYGEKYVIPEVTYKSVLDGKEYTLKDVPIAVHDTGGAFKGRPDKLDIATGRASSDAEAYRLASNQQFLGERTQTYIQYSELPDSTAESPSTSGGASASVPIPQQRPDAADIAYQESQVVDVNTSAFPISIGAVERGNLPDITPDYNKLIPTSNWTPPSAAEITAQINEQNGKFAVDGLGGDTAYGPQSQAEVQTVLDANDQRLIDAARAQGLADQQANDAALLANQRAVELDSTARAQADLVAKNDAYDAQVAAQQQLKDDEAKYLAARVEQAPATLSQKPDSVVDNRPWWEKLINPAPASSADTKLATEQAELMEQNAQAQAEFDAQRQVQADQNKILADRQAQAVAETAAYQQDLTNQSTKLVAGDAFNSGVENQDWTQQKVQDVLNNKESVRLVENGAFDSGVSLSSQQVQAALNADALNRGRSTTDVAYENFYDAVGIPKESQVSREKLAEIVQSAAAPDSLGVQYSGGIEYDAKAVALIDSGALDSGAEVKPTVLASNRVDDAFQALENQQTGALTQEAILASKNVSEQNRIQDGFDALQGNQSTGNITPEALLASSKGTPQDSQSGSQRSAAVEQLASSMQKQLEEQQSVINQKIAAYTTSHPGLAESCAEAIGGGGNACMGYRSFQSQIAIEQEKQATIVKNYSAVLDHKNGNAPLNPELELSVKKVEQGQGQNSLALQSSAEERITAAKEPFAAIAKSYHDSDYVGTVINTAKAAVTLPKAAGDFLAGTLIHDTGKVLERVEHLTGADLGFNASAKDIARCATVGENVCNGEAIGSAVNAVGTVWAGGSVAKIGATLAKDGFVAVREGFAVARVGGEAGALTQESGAVLNVARSTDTAVAGAQDIRAGVIANDNAALNTTQRAVGGSPVFEQPSTYAGLPKTSATDFAADAGAASKIRIADVNADPYASFNKTLTEMKAGGASGEVSPILKPYTADTGNPFLGGSDRIPSGAKSSGAASEIDAAARNVTNSAEQLKNVPTGPASPLAAETPKSNVFNFGDYVPAQDGNIRIASNRITNVANDAGENLVPAQSIETVRIPSAAEPIVDSPAITSAGRPVPVSSAPEQTLDSYIGQKWGDLKTWTSEKLGFGTKAVPEEVRAAAPVQDTALGDGAPSIVKNFEIPQQPPTGAVVAVEPKLTVIETPKPFVQDVALGDGAPSIAKNFEIPAQPPQQVVESIIPQTARTSPSASVPASGSKTVQPWGTVPANTATEASAARPGPWDISPKTSGVPIVGTEGASGTSGAALNAARNTAESATDVAKATYTACTGGWGYTGACAVVGYGIYSVGSNSYSSVKQTVGSAYDSASNAVKSAVSSVTGETPAGAPKGTSGNVPTPAAPETKTPATPAPAAKPAPSVPSGNPANSDPAPAAAPAGGGQVFSSDTYCVKSVTPMVVVNVPAGTPFPAGSCYNTPGVGSSGQASGFGNIIGQLAGKLFGSQSAQQSGASQAAAQTPPSPSTTPQPASTLKSIVTPVANPATVTSGGTASISWSAVGSTSCTLFDSQGQKVAAGSPNPEKAYTTLALTETSKYKITCTGGSGATSADVTVSVQ